MTPDRTTALRLRFGAYLRLIRLDKPVGFMLLMWPTLWGLWIAAQGAPAPHLIVIFALGTILMRSAGCAINDWADRDFDGAVKRTAMRPLAAGEINGREAMAVAAVCAAAAASLLIALNHAARLWAIPALAIAACYPFTKRFFSVPQAFLGIAFSMGIPMAFAAVRSDTPSLAGWLMFANFFWVMAYDTEYAMVDRDDDVRIGIHTSALFFGRFDVLAVGICYAMFLTSMAWIGRDIGLGHGYAVALVLASLIALRHIVLLRGRERANCFAAFRGNNLLGLVLFAGIALDYALRRGAWPH